MFTGDIAFANTGNATINNLNTPDGQVLITTTGTLNLGTALNLSGSSLLDLRANGFSVTQSITGGGLVNLDGGAGTLSINNVPVSAANLNLSGVRVDNYSTTLSVSNVLNVSGSNSVHWQAGFSSSASAFANSINIAGGDVILDGGTSPGDFVTIQATGATTVTGNKLVVQGGTGTGAFAQLQGGSLLDINVIGNVDVGGGSADAFGALIGYMGDVSIVSGSTTLPGEVTLTPGTGSNADAVIVANMGMGAVDISAAACNGCDTLTADPFANTATEMGIFADPINLVIVAPPAGPDVGDSTEDVGANEVLVLKELFDDSTEAGGSEEDDEEDTQMLTCTFE